MFGKNHNLEMKSEPRNKPDFMSKNMKLLKERETNETET
jgi:hypothetical protein